ncbi:MAG: hypothetical protein GX638_03225 [Crenarchaeota archaeon]|nr:hypothetical protein [Thermoproteota archaeon]
MRKYHAEEKIETVKHLDSIICNKCGREFIADECELWKNGNDSMEIYSFGRTGGYGSKIGDELEWSMDLCEDCIIKIMASCKVPPTFKDRGGIGSILAVCEEGYDCQKFQEEWLKEKREKLENQK